MRAILALLRQTGHEKDAEEIAEKWNQYVKLIGDVEPTDYDLCYPDNLLCCRVDHVLETCRSIGLKPFTDTMSDEIKPNLVALMNEAWMEFLSNPRSYSEWESRKVEELFCILLH